MKWLLKPYYKRRELIEYRESQLYLFIARRSSLMESVDRKPQDIKHVQRVLTRTGITIQDNDILEYWRAVDRGDMSVINNEDYFKNKYTYNYSSHVNAESDEAWISLIEEDFPIPY